jgi:hypothetical protein
MAESEMVKSGSTSLWVILGVGAGIVIGGVFAYFMIKASQQRSAALLASQQYSPLIQQSDTFSATTIQQMQEHITQLERQLEQIKTTSILTLTPRERRGGRPSLEPQNLSITSPQAQDNGLIKNYETQETQVSPQAPPQQSYERRDTEFIKWYTDTIIKPSIQQTARDSVDKAIQSMKLNEVQTVDKPPISKATAGNWMITRDSEGAIMSIETFKHSAQSRETKATHLNNPVQETINISKQHIYK